MRDFQRLQMRADAGERLQIAFQMRDSGGLHCSKLGRDDTLVKFIVLFKVYCIPSKTDAVACFQFRFGGITKGIEPLFEVGFGRDVGEAALGAQTGRGGVLDRCPSRLGLVTGFSRRFRGREARSQGKLGRVILRGIALETVTDASKEAG